jgi:hypothetical protein
MMQDSNVRSLLLKNSAMGKKHDSFSLFLSLSIIVFVLVAGFAFALPAGAAANSCLTCHSSLAGESVAGLAYQVWKDSAHDNAGVACNGCHRGDPAKERMEDAHKGILGPEETESRIHMVNILKICGRCHEPQLKEFTLSKHHRAIQSKDKVRGPTCITCHGSMHTAILEPNNVAKACRRCHNKERGLSPNIPEEAHATLDLIFYARSTIKWSGEFVALAQKQGYPVHEAVEALQKAEEQFRLSGIKWHSLDFHEILKLVDGAYESAKKAKRLADREVTQGVLKEISEKE